MTHEIVADWDMTRARFINATLRSERMLILRILGKSGIPPDCQIHIVRFMVDTQE